MTQFEPQRRYCSKAEMMRVLHRLGIPETTIAEIQSKVADPVDLEESGALLQTYGLTRDAIVSRLGGSP